MKDRSLPRARRGRPECLPAGDRLHPHPDPLPSRERELPHPHPFGFAQGKPDPLPSRERESTCPQVYFIGAGPGDPELLTIKGRKALGRSDVVIYADSLVHPGMLRYARKGAEVHKSAGMSLAEVREVMLKSVAAGKVVARVHSGDPSLYGAILEQLAFLEEHRISYAIIPGVSAVFAAAAALKTELTVPEIAQTVIISRLSGRTPVPEDLRALGAHHTTLVLYLSVKEIQRVVTTLLEAGYSSDTPAAVVYRVTWQDEKRIQGTLADIVSRVEPDGIEKQALILVGRVFAPGLKVSDFARSRLYDASFSHGRRSKREPRVNSVPSPSMGESQACPE